MKNRLISLLAYAIFWLALFITARAFFLLTHLPETTGSEIPGLLLTFWHGLKLDISATGYVFLLPVLLMIPGFFIKGEWFRHFIRYYTFTLIVLSAGIIVSDTLIYKYWGFRMDHTALFYLKTPKEAVASVTTFQAVVVIVAVAAFSALFIFLYNRFINRYFKGFTPVRKWYFALVTFLLLWGSLIIPIRGGVGIAPINAGSVYFSTDMFLNHASVNVVWNVGSSLFNSKPVSNPYIFHESSSAELEVKNLLSDNCYPEKVLNTTRPNVLIIVLESFGSSLVGPLGGDTLTTPFLNGLARESILFTNFYASGNRTDKAMPAILNGYPAQPAESIMKEPKKTQSLPGIIKALSAEGYRSAFWYGGEINFANFNSFILNSGFRTIITMDNFSPVHYNSKWGVHDDILLAQFKDSMSVVKEPFVNVLLTLSSHEPFEVPMEPVFKGNDDLTKFRNSVVYTDRSVGEFIEWAKTTKWWNNTLVILVADHCRRSSVDVPAWSEDIFRIPMLWTGGAVKTPGMIVSKYGSQTDLPVTLLKQMELPVAYPFAKDLLCSESSSFAFYTFNEGFGFITDSSKYIYDHKLGSSVLEQGAGAEKAEMAGKAFLQLLYDDFLKK